MAIVETLFGILLLASCAYAFVFGGKEGRWVSLLLMSAAVLSIPAGHMDRGWSRVHVPVLIVDLLLLAGLLSVALRSRRYWPVWMAAFHLLSITTHIARMGEADLPPVVYFALQSFWSLPLLLVMVAGIMLDRRAGLPKNAPLKALFYDLPRNPG